MKTQELAIDDFRPTVTLAPRSVWIPHVYRNPKDPSTFSKRFIHAMRVYMGHRSYRVAARILRRRPIDTEGIIIDFLANWRFHVKHGSMTPMEDMRLRTLFGGSAWTEPH